MVNILDTSPTHPKEPHIIKLFPHDLASPQVKLVPSKKPKIFVVAKFWVPGIYNSWNECCEQISGYPDTKYCSFSTQEEADTYLLSMTEVQFCPTILQKLLIENPVITDLDVAQ